MIIEIRLAIIDIPTPTFCMQDEYATTGEHIGRIEMKEKTTQTHILVRYKGLMYALKSYSRLAHTIIEV